MAAVSPHDVWGVGYWQDGTANAPLIEHWNGSRWMIIANPQSVTTGLAGVSADTANDAWAVGYNFAESIEVTIAEHWNGTGWSIVSSPNQPAANALYSITALSGNTIWAVGSALTSDITSDTLVEHWDGAQWSVVASPNVAGAPGSFLPGVAVVSPRDVWAVGYVSASQTTALIEHWNGVKWRIVAGPTGTNESHLNAVVHVPGTETAWAVGEMGGFALTEFRM